MTPTLSLTLSLTLTLTLTLTLILALTLALTITLRLNPTRLGSACRRCRACRPHPRHASEDRTALGAIKPWHHRAAVEPCHPLGSKRRNSCARTRWQLTCFWSNGYEARARATCRSQTCVSRGRQKWSRASAC